MQIRNILLFTDIEHAVLGMTCEKLVQKQFVKEVVTFQDFIMSRFSYDSLAQIAPITITGVDIDGVCLFYPKLKGQANEAITVVRVGGIQLSAGITNEKAWLEHKADHNEFKEDIKQILDRLEQAKALLLLEAKELGLFQKPSDFQLIGEPTRDTDKYFKALAVQALFSTEYSEGNGAVADILEDELISPYNDALRGKVENGVVKRWGKGKNSAYAEIGPRVLLQVPDYKEVFHYFNAVNTGDIDENDMELEFLDESDAYIEKVEDSISSPESITLSYLVQNTQQVELLLESVDFEVERIPPEQVVDGKTLLYRAVPLHPQVYHIDESTPEYYDSFDYAKLSDNPSVNLNNIPKEHICGSSLANILPLFPREQYWYTLMRQTVLELLMLENKVLSVSAAEELVARGVCSKYISMLFKEMLGPVLHITRGYTGRTTFDGAKYIRLKGGYSDSKFTDSEQSAYISERTCFYTIAQGKYNGIPIPPNYIPSSHGQYRVLKQSIVNFVDTYVEDSFGWVEIILRLLRDTTIKPTALVLEKAYKKEAQGTVPVCFDLNKCTTTPYIDGVEALTPADTQEVIFGIRLNSHNMGALGENGIVQNLQTDILGDNFKYQNDFIIGVGLWSKMLETEYVSRIDFVDIFTLVQYYKEKRCINSVPISVIDIEYDPHTNLFQYDSDDDIQIDAVLNTVSNGAFQAGSINLKDAVSKQLFSNHEDIVNGHMCKEYRTVLESYSYTKIKETAAEMLQNPKLAQNGNYTVFNQLLQLSANPKRLNESAKVFERYWNESSIPATLEHDVYMTAVLDIRYTANFLKLVSYCLAMGITPESNFVDYLNAVNKFMAGVSYEPPQSETFKESFKKVKSWFGCLVPNQGSHSIVCFVGQYRVGAEIYTVLVENDQNANREYIAEITEKIKQQEIAEDKAKAQRISYRKKPLYVRFVDVYLRAGAGWKSNLGRTTFTATPNTMQFIDKYYRIFAHQVGGTHE